MADKTIGDLTAAIALAGADFFEIQQGGVSKQAALSLFGDLIAPASTLWTPVLNGFAVVGATTLSGRWIKFGSLVFWSWSIAAATTIQSTAASSFITGLPYNSNVNMSFSVTDDLAGDRGTGNHIAGSGMFTPTWTASARTFAASGFLFTA